MSAFDISMIFQKGTEITPSVVGLLDLVNVTMSPQQYKAFVRASNETLAAYEKVFGKLTLPDQDTQPVRNADQISATINDLRDIAKKQSEITSYSNAPQPPSEQSPSVSRKKGKPP
jgi:hypothetical protein